LVGANAVVVFVDYDRSPESRYPVAVEESYAVLKYVAEHPDEFGADASRIAIARRLGLIRKDKTPGRHCAIHTVLHREFAMGLIELVVTVCALSLPSQCEDLLCHD
jgi:alpha/beta hydrolase fold